MSFHAFWAEPRRTAGWASDRVRRSKRLAGVAAGFVIALAGCGNQVDTITPEIQARMMSDLQAGKQTLTCTLNCILTWNTQVSSLQGLDLAEKWDDLTIRVMQIGYGNDLAYYYLGQAAQGLGYHQPAIDYYRYALALATGSNALMRCESAQAAGTGDTCQGVDLPSSIPQLIDASQAVLDQQAADAAAAAAAAAAPKVHHYRPKKPASSFVTPPPPGSSTTGSGFATPPPPPSP